MTSDKKLIGSERDGMKTELFAVKEKKDRVMNDYCLMNVFSNLEIEDLFALMKTSKQFYECIHSDIKARKHLTVGVSDLIEYQLDYKYFLCVDAYHSSNVIEYYNNDISSAIKYKNSIYYLDESLNTFAIITNKFNCLECLALKDCYLDEKTFEFIDENLKHLKCLSLIHCYISYKQIHDILANNIFLAENIIHLSFDRLFCIETNTELRSLFIQLIVNSLTNLQNLSTIRESVQDIRKLFIVLPQTISKVNLINERFDQIHIHLHTLPQTLGGMDGILDIASVQQIKHLIIDDYISEDNFLRQVNEKLDLISLSFQSENINWETFVGMADKHKHLKNLFIVWTDFRHYKHIEDTKPFESVRRLVLLNTETNPKFFREFLDLFPKVLEIHYWLPFLLCECSRNYMDPSIHMCKSCRDKCFNLILKIKSLKILRFNSFDISRESIDDMLNHQNLCQLFLSHYWTGIKMRVNADVYDMDLRNIILVMNEKSIRSPKKLFKLFVTENTIIPKDIGIARNLNIIVLNGP